jgi:hypothetical protein
MNILGAIRREERKLEKQAGKLQRQLNGLKAAAETSSIGSSKALTCAARGERFFAGLAMTNWASTIAAPNGSRFPKKTQPVRSRALYRCTCSSNRRNCLTG